MNRDANGRYEVDPDSRRYHRTVRLTQQEDEELQRRAAAAQLSVSEYMRRCALVIG